MTKLEQLDDALLEAKLTEILEKWPLYRELRYTGTNIVRLPDQIRYYCSQCERMQSLLNTVNRAQKYNDRMGFSVDIFVCQNCNRWRVLFAYYWGSLEGEKNAFLFRKYGQWPPLEERITPELNQALRGTDDLKFYETCLRLRNFGFGIAAMAYMRRIVEHHIDEIIDILREEARTAEQTKNIEEIRTARFAEKLDVATGLFPKHLIPDDSPNPLMPLYKLSSEALHSLSEEESVELFDECRLVFEFVFSELRPHLKKSKDFRNALQRLAVRSTSRG